MDGFVARTVATLAALALCAATLGCGGAKKKIEVAPKMTPISAPDDAFTKAVRKRAQQIKRVPTAGLPELDTGVLQEIIGTRLREVTERVLRDALRNAAAAIESKPAQDLVASLASLVVRQADQEARSQTVVSAMLRSGMSAGFATLANAFDELRGECGGDKDANWVALLDTSYEALASTDALRSLGWTEVTGEVPKGCEKMQRRIVQIVELGARIQSNFDPKAVLADATAVVNKCVKNGVKLINFDPTDPNLKLSDLGYFAAQLNLFLNSPEHDCRDAVNTFISKHVRSLTNVIGAAGEQLALADLEASITDLRGMIESDAAGAAQKLNAWRKKTRPLLAVIRKLIEQEKLGRDDVIALAQWLDEAIGPRVDRLKSKRAKKLIDSAIAELPNLFREDDRSRIGIKVDVPGLLSTVTSTLLKDQREGFYLRASVGSGYVVVDDDTESAFYEELGVGYRWGSNEFLFGPHLVASGVLYSTVSQSEALDDRTFVGAGVSFNMYRLLDLSANLGAMVDIGGSEDTQFSAFVGLQIPLYDYLSALGTGTK
jgi:hypothetical protein